MLRNWLRRLHIRWVAWVENREVTVLHLLFDQIAVPPDSACVWTRAAKWIPHNRSAPARRHMKDTMASL